MDFHNIFKTFIAGVQSMLICRMPTNFRLVPHLFIPHSQIDPL